MIPIDEKKKIWKEVKKEFPDDEMMQNLHFIREIIILLQKREKGKSWTELGEMARKEFKEWLEAQKDEGRT